MGGVLRRKRQPSRKSLVEFLSFFFFLSSEDVMVDKSCLITMATNIHHFFNTQTSLKKFSKHGFSGFVNRLHRNRNFFTVMFQNLIISVSYNMFPVFVRKKEFRFDVMYFLVSDAFFYDGEWIIRFR